MNTGFGISLVAAFLLPALASLEASEEGEGLLALQQFSKSSHLEKGEVVLGLVGFYGNPLPPQWLILSTLNEKPGVLKESVFARGKVIAERRFQKQAGQDLPDIPIDTTEIETSSRAAFSTAEKAAVKNQVSFESVHYQMRCRAAEREPVWMLSLINKAQVVVGVVYVSARNGEILQSSWPLREKRDLTESQKGS